MTTVETFKTIDDKLMYISNYNEQNCSFRLKIKLIVENFRHYNQSKFIKGKQMRECYHKILGTIRV